MSDDPEPWRRHGASESTREEDDATLDRLIQSDVSGSSSRVRSMENASRLSSDRAAAPDLVKIMLSELRSVHSRRAYAGDLKAFFGGSYTNGDVIAWVTQDAAQIAVSLNEYKGEMIGSGLTEATVNRRIAALRSLLSKAALFGLSSTDGRGLVKAEKVIPYRDTKGISLPLQRKLLELPDLATEKGLRDACILRLALENGLRCFEVTGLSIADVSPGEKQIKIRGKGRGTKVERIDVSAKWLAAVKDYLIATERWRTKGKSPGPSGAGALFLSCHHDPAHYHQPLTNTGLYQVIVAYGKQIGVTISPHRLRHSAITEVLRHAKGNLAEAMDFSRHKNANVLQMYNDNRGKAQGKLTRKRSREL